MITVDKWFLPLTLAAALGCGLMSGVFFAFSVFVMKALSRLPAREGIVAMQAINAAIVNPLFFAVFFGTTIACGWIVVASVLRWHEAGAAYCLVGGLLYLVGTFLITAAFNVPLNEKLATITPNDLDAPALWSRYVARWSAWNHVRTVASLSAAAALILALCCRGAKS